MKDEAATPKISGRVWFFFRWGFPVFYGLWCALFGLGVRIIMDYLAGVPVDPKQAAIVCAICFISGALLSFVFWRPWRVTRG